MEVVPTALHFVLLLFLQALLNVIVLLWFRDGVLETAHIVNSAVTIRPDTATLAVFADYIDRVGVEPDFSNFTTNVWSMLDEHNSSRAAVESRNATVFVYLAETAVKVAEVRGATGSANSRPWNSASRHTNSTACHRG